MSTSTRVRPPNWKARAPAPLPGPAFASQKGLPRLPVPPLAQTLDRLKESLRPIACTSDEYDAVTSKIDSFAAQQGPDLQKRLEQHAASRDHWLEEWWDDGAYLSYRDSVVINVSYYYGFTKHPSHLKQTPAARAAALARGAMLFRQQWKLGQLEPDRAKDTAFCMDTFRWMFDCCRVPGHGIDWSVSHAKAGDTGNSGHIIVTRNNRFWKVPAAQDGHILSTEDFERQIQSIYDASEGKPYPAVGVLAASNRDKWAHDYDELITSAHNSAITDAIHSAAFLISLEPTPKPASDAPEASHVAHSRALWHGAVVNGQPIGLQNRWVDKPVQFIVFDDGYAGIMGEHSVMDGTPMVRLCDDVLAALEKPDFNHGAPAPRTPEPTALDWEVSSATEAAITRANTEAVQLIESQAVTFLRTGYGKASIKAAGVSPDSWAQLIVQLAYARLLARSGKQRAGGTYEAATTRRFRGGRTEAIRVVSSESDAWVAAMDADDVGTQARRELFHAAVKTHVRRAKEAGAGHGVDRHVLGLKKCLREGEHAPELFSDPVLARSSNWVLSTSAIFSKRFDTYGWGEVVPEGFGVPYMTGFNGTCGGFV
ncbi:acyltransferase ChoActase/COT/CPT [Schizophyllum amplum]|uniref:Acyltransferase ChoActase/COT/CPT n=1 Tax=Schizophyllum amplum TaxID=97359 RepID=A0A550CYE5_9AGAR|nr:acyltransferase ChoActase/COT/CPT [Auriculariopsis ampla]